MVPSGRTPRSSRTRGRWGRTSGRVSAPTALRIPGGLLVEEDLLAVLGRWERFEATDPVATATYLRDHPELAARLEAARAATLEQREAARDGERTARVSAANAAAVE